MAKPRLSLLLPTFSRAEFLRPMLARALAEASRCELGTVEVVVSDNASQDHTAEVLSRAQARHVDLRVAHTPQHYLTAEENLLHGLKQCDGDYVWTIGDDDEIAPGAVRRVLKRLEAPDPPAFMLFNIATMDTAGRQVRSSLLSMNGAEVSWSIERIIAGGGLMGLGACFTAAVSHRETLLSAPWSEALDWSPIYAHVIIYLAAFRGADCRLINEAIATARVGGTTLEDFSRFADNKGHYTFWPWTIGLPRHFARLMAEGHVEADFPSRIVEPQPGGPMRLLPYLLRAATLQLAAWVEHGHPLHALCEPDLDALTTIAAAAPRAERELTRHLCGWARLAASLHDPDSTIRATDALEIFSREEREALAEHIPNGKHTGLLGAGVRAFPAGTSKTDQTLDKWLKNIGGEAELEVRRRITESAATTLRQLSASLVLGSPGPDLELASGFKTQSIGGFYVAYPDDWPLPSWQVENLRTVDPVGTPGIVLAPNLASLEERLGDFRRRGENCSGPTERFAGWTLGRRRGQEFAKPGSGDGDVRAITVAGDRKALRREVLRLRREAAAVLRFPELATEAAATIDEADHQWVRGAAWFDGPWYLLEYPEAALLIERGCFEDAAHHWLALNGRFAASPSPWFDADQYVADHPNVELDLTSGRYPTAFHHYRAVGAQENAVPFQPFDPQFYLRTYSDAAEAFEGGSTPLEHYLTIGMSQDRRISETFDSDAYLRANPDVAIAVRAGAIVSGLVHYVQHGRREGRAVR